MDITRTNLTEYPDPRISNNPSAKVHKIVSTHTQYTACRQSTGYIETEMKTDIILLGLFRIGHVPIRNA